MYHSKSVDEVIREFGSSGEGLSKEEAAKRLKSDGPNELPRKKRKSVLKILFEELFNPIEVILLVTLLLSFVVGEYVDCIALLIIILVDVIIGTYQEWKALKDAESLLGMIKSTVFVIRDGKEFEINSYEVVCGDIIKGEKKYVICWYFGCYW